MKLEDLLRETMIGTLIYCLKPEEAVLWSLWCW